MSALRDRQRQERRDSILAAARTLFVQDGYESFSMRKLAAQVGCSAAGLYQHFACKQDLFHALTQEDFAALGQQIESARASVESADPVLMLKAGLRAYIEFGLAHPEQYRFVFMSAATTVRADFGDALFHSLQERIATSIRSQMFQDVDTALAAQIIWSAIHGLTALLIVRPTFPWSERSTLISRTIDHTLQPFRLEQNSHRALP